MVFLGKPSREEGAANGSPPSQNVSVSQSEAPSKQASTEDEPWLSSPNDAIFPETIPEESSSTEEEHVVNYTLDILLLLPNLMTLVLSILR